MHLVYSFHTLATFWLWFIKRELAYRCAYTWFYNLNIFWRMPFLAFGRMYTFSEGSAHSFIQVLYVRTYLAKVFSLPFCALGQLLTKAKPTSSECKNFSGFKGGGFFEWHIYTHTLILFTHIHTHPSTSGTHSVSPNLQVPFPFFETVFTFEYWSLIPGCFPVFIQLYL